MYTWHLLLCFFPSRVKNPRKAYLIGQGWPYDLLIGLCSCILFRSSSGSRQRLLPKPTHSGRLSRKAVRMMLWGLVLDVGQPEEAAFFFCCCYSVAQLCPTVSTPVDCTITSFPVLHYLLEFAQIHVHWVGDAIQPLSWIIFNHVYHPSHI